MPPRKTHLIVWQGDPPTYHQRRLWEDHQAPDGVPYPYPTQFGDLPGEEMREKIEYDRLRSDVREHGSMVNAVKASIRDIHDLGWEGEKHMVY